MKITQLKYKEVEIEIRQLAQTLPVGSKLPSERDLAISYDCNFLTVRRALKQLVDDGTVVRRIGSGTFVSRHQGMAEPSRRKEGTIGALLFQRGNAYSYRVLQSIAHAGLEQGVELRSSWVRNFAEDGLNQAQQLKKEGCVALTLPWFPHEIVEEVRTFVQRSPLPVSIAMAIPGLEKNCFEQESIFGSHAIVSTEALCGYYQHLGHRRIAFLGPDLVGDVILQKKLSSYACYTSRHDLQNLCGLVMKGTAAMDNLVERWKRYRGDLAIVSYDDEHALRFMTAMHKTGLAAPDDFAMIGFNDTEASLYSDPPLTTIRQNFDYIGSWLLKSAIALSQGGVSQSSEVSRPQLLIRSTCGGRGKVDAAFRAKIPTLDLIIDDHVAPSDAEETPVLQAVE
ncbi:MAG TPA: substrate-binding domain-containing protein [Candidatus Methylacidiphilales bacterium]